jgi:glycosyltransferase involved in cell wall biosynthesis
MSEIYFSIVTPVYNGEKYLEDTIKSVVNQSFKNFEYIVIDGESKDNSINIINKYKNKITKIISEKDNNMYEAIHKGFSLASGHYYLWLNSDDVLIDNHVLERLYFLLKKKKYQWIIGKIAILENNKIKNYFPLSYPQFIIKNGLANNCFWGFIQQENVVFSKDLYNKSGSININYKMAGDFHLWKNFALHEKLISINLPIAAHRKWPGQMTQLDQYYYEIKKKRCKINFFYLLRFIYSLLMLPIIYFRDFNVQNNK